MSVYGRQYRREGHAKSADYSQITRRFLTHGSQTPQEQPMAPGSQFCFADYRLDLHNEQLWCGSQALPLTTKALRVLGLLMVHAGQLVSKDALFQAVWPEAAVSDGVLSNCIGELRKALGETAQAPLFIQTVHRRGYRFLAPVTVS